MSAGEFNCPSCGASLKVENRFSKVVICCYCGQTCSVVAEGLDPAGEKVTLADFKSIFSIGATGSLAGDRFKTLGRLRYSYDGGFWDEWFLQFDKGQKLWLQEDEGEFTCFEKETLTSPVPPFSEISVGSMILVNEHSVFVTEKNQAEISGGVGELYFSITPGEEVNCVDGNSGGRLVSIEFTPNEINLSFGKEISINEILIDSI